MASRLQQLVTAFIAGLNDPAITVTSGRKEIAQWGSPPRIVYIYNGGPIVPPDMVGGGLLSLDTVEGQRANIIRVRNANLLVSMQGRTEEETEQLLHNTVAAWEAIASGAVSFDQEQWPEQQEGKDDYERRGCRVTMILTVNIPIYNAVRQLTRPAGQVLQADLITQMMYGPTNTYGSGAKYRSADSISIP